MVAEDADVDWGSSRFQYSLVWRNGYIEVQDNLINTILNIVFRIVFNWLN